MRLSWKESARPSIAGLMILAAPVILTACHGGSAQESDPGARNAVVVRTAPVAWERISRPIVASGTFSPKDEIALSFKIGGVVEAVEVDAGAAVQAGQFLASLHLREIDATLSKARSAAAKAERDLGRARRLYADSVATLSQVQDAETGYEVAQADLEAAEFNRRYAVIRAPADGVILRRRSEPGETVNPGQSILVLGSRARGAVLRVGLADRDLVRVRLGDTAVARFDALPGHAFHGRVTEIGAAATPGLGTYPVEITLEGADPLASGMVGRAELFPTEGSRSALVPVEAVLEADGPEAVVFALSEDESRALRKVVTVDFLDGGRVAVRRGLEGVRAVVTDGAAWILDGDAVRVIR